MTERLDRDKGYSLLRPSISDKEKSFVPLMPGPNVTKLFMAISYDFSK